VLLPGSSHWRLLAISLALAALVMPARAWAARGETLLVSRANGPSGVGANDDSSTASISADGRFVAFYSDADDLSEDDNNNVTNVFVRDMQLGTTTLVSRADGAAGAGGDDYSYNPTISADGRFVAFYSSADNLSAADDDNVTNVFVRDTQLGTTTLVSRADGPAGPGGDDFSFDPTISADGRFVAFESDADNLSADDNNNVTNVFVRDTQLGTTTLVSRADGVAGAGADDGAVNPKISADGRFVAFESRANNLSSDDLDPVLDVFVRDTQLGTTTLVSRADGPAGAGGNYTSGSPTISADGRFVAFESDARNLSADDNNNVTNVFVRDTQLGTTMLVSRADGPAGAGGDGNSANPSISADGRFVAFASLAANLSADDNNVVLNVFVRDTQMGTTVLVSRANGPSGAGADSDSYIYGDAISADGRFVTFESLADNLSPKDSNAFDDVFRRDLRGGPPHCADITQTVVRDIDTTIGLTCADDDGDAMTLAIVSGPAQGVLGAIDQAALTVTYSPNVGAAGADAFTFRASDVNGDSGAATARLTVAGCSAAATFGSIACRLDELAAAKAAAVPAGRLATKLGRLLTRTGERLVAAQANLGRPRVVRKVLGRAAKAVGAFGHQLGSPAGKKLGSVTVAALRGAAAAIRDDVVKLMRASG